MRPPRAQARGADAEGEIPLLRRVKPAQRPGRILWCHATSAEGFGAQRRRGGGTEYNPQTNREPLEAPCWPPELAPCPLEVRPDIGLKGRTSEIAAQVHKAAALEYVEMHPKKYTLSVTSTAQQRRAEPTVVTGSTLNERTRKRNLRPRGQENVQFRMRKGGVKRMRPAERTA